MKKILFILFFPILAFAQSVDSTHVPKLSDKDGVFIEIDMGNSFNEIHGECGAKEKRFNRYASVSGGFSDTKDVFGSAEIGLWGNSEPLMLAVSYDYMKSKDNTKSEWLGFNTYYQMYEKNDNYLFVYVAPKLNITNTDDYLIQYGLSYYQRLSSNWYPSGSLSFQRQVPSFSLGMNYVW